MFWERTERDEESTPPYISAVEPTIFGKEGQSDIRSIYVLDHWHYPRRHRVARALLDRGVRMGEHLFEVRSLEHLPLEQGEMLKTLLYNGHVTVWLRLSVESELFHKLLELFPRARMDCVHDTIHLKTAANELEDLARSLSATEALVSFGDDGCPMYVWTQAETSGAPRGFRKAAG